MLESDDFRFILHLHTTSRQLYVCSELIKILGVAQLPKSVVDNKIINWSITEEQINQTYNKSRGKLTENGKKTTALSHYFQLCESFGLIISFNQIYSNSRIGNVLFNLSSINSKVGKLHQIELNFYLFQLLKIDADGLFLILDFLAEFEEINQKKLQQNFKRLLNSRLLAKQPHASATVKIIINERFRAINYIWKSAEKYAEHLLIPRCEWLITIGILEQRREKSSTLYKFTEIGKEFYDKIPMITDSLKDINEDWLYSNYFSLLNNLDKKKTREDFSNFSTEKQIEELGKYLEITFSDIKSSSSFRLPIYESLLYTCLKMFDVDIVINFKDIIATLELGITYKNKNYRLKNNGRLNESYIITRVV
jgi:predicted house-cleaning noncanonical NTP pyrophosphatase (MazG superfamily)